MRLAEEREREEAIFGVARWELGRTREEPKSIRRETTPFPLTLIGPSG